MDLIFGWSIKFWGKVSVGGKKIGLKFWPGVKISGIRRGEISSTPRTFRHFPPIFFPDKVWSQFLPLEIFRNTTNLHKLWRLDFVWNQIYRSIDKHQVCWHIVHQDHYKYSSLLYIRLCLERKRKWKIHCKIIVVKLHYDCPMLKYQLENLKSKMRGLFLWGWKPFQ